MTASSRSTSRSCRTGPAAYFATLPIKACVAEMRKAGLPAAVSNTAGTFVCNHIFYAADGHRRAAIPTGLPRRLPAHPLSAGAGGPLGGAPSMALDDIVRGIEIILAVSAERMDDITRWKAVFPRAANNASP